jgi:hypothetical protein
MKKQIPIEERTDAAVLADISEQYARSVARGKSEIEGGLFGRSGHVLPRLAETWGHMLAMMSHGSDSRGESSSKARNQYDTLSLLAFVGFEAGALFIRAQSKGRADERFWQQHLKTAQQLIEVYESVWREPAVKPSPEPAKPNPFDGEETEAEAWEERLLDASSSSPLSLSTELYYAVEAQADVQNDCIDEAMGAATYWGYLAGLRAARQLDTERSHKETIKEALASLGESGQTKV